MKPTSKSVKPCLGLVIFGLGLALGACEGTSSNPSTCLKDGSVTWWVNPNKEGQVKDTATAENCAKAKR